MDGARKMRELGGMGEYGVSFPATACEQMTSSRRCTAGPAARAPTAADTEQHMADAAPGISVIALSPLVGTIAMLDFY